MKELDRRKLSVEFMSGTTPLLPYTGRKYTLFRSLPGNNLLLKIGLEYLHDTTQGTIDEVLAKWRVSKNNNQLVLYVQVFVDKYGNPEECAVRDAIIRRNMELWLKAILNGDRQFILARPALYTSPVIVHFDSSNSFFNRKEQWGKVHNYL